MVRTYKRGTPKSGRPPTHGQPFKGVKKEVSGSTWSVRVDNLNVGAFEDARSAAHGFDRALCVLKGPSSKYNLPDEMPEELEAALAAGFPRGQAGLKAYAQAHKLLRAQDRNNTYCSGSSRYRGVFWHRDDCVWLVQVSSRDGVVYRGEDEEEAARAHDRSAIQRLGSKTFTNFPPSSYFSQEELDEIDERVAATLSSVMKCKAGPLEAASLEQRAYVEA